MGLVRQYNGLAVELPGILEGRKDKDIMCPYCRGWYASCKATEVTMQLIKVAKQRLYKEPEIMHDRSKLSTI